MDRASRGSLFVPAILYALTALLILMAAVRAVQVPTGTLPPDAAKFYDAPVAFWLHAVAGLIFAVLGPMQFSRVARQRFGAWHRRAGRVQVAAGAVLGLSGLRLSDRFGGQIDPTDMARIAFAAILLVCLWQAVARIRAGDVAAHRDWMIRGYAVAMGTAPLALVYLPIFVIMGAFPPPGPLDHAIFVGTWCASIAAGETVIVRLRRQGRSPTPPP